MGLELEVSSYTGLIYKGEISQNIAEEATTSSAIYNN